MKSMEFKAYEILKDKLGEEKAATLLGFAGEKLEEQKSAFKDKLDEQKNAFQEKFDQLKNVFLTKEDKVDLIKWMVGFWIAQIAAILGLYLKK